VSKAEDVRPMKLSEMNSPEQVAANILSEYQKKYHALDPESHTLLALKSFPAIRDTERQDEG
jgi:hypothetical protein